MSGRADAVVIGAGVVGAAVADALSAAGMRVTVLEASIPGGGATAAGMGHVVAMDDSDAQFALTSYSQRLLEPMLAMMPPSCEPDRCGTLWLAEDEAQLQAVHEKHAYYAARGVAATVLDGGDVARAEPNLRAGLAGALHVPADSVVYPPGLCRWLLERALERGATLHTGAQVVRIDEGAAVTADARFEAPVLVNAAGAAAPLLMPDLPIVPRRGHLVITDRAPGFCRHQLVELGYLQSAHTMSDASVAFNIQPRATGQMLIGSSRELVGWDSRVNRGIVARMLRRALDFMPSLARLSAIRTWIGFRPATKDKLPLIGRLPGVSGAWVAAGHEGLGITTALGTAAILADLVLERTPAIDAAPFAVERVHAAVQA